MIKTGLRRTLLGSLGVGIVVVVLAYVLLYTFHVDAAEVLLLPGLYFATVTTDPHGSLLFVILIPLIDVLQYATLFFMIAATYTPFAVNRLEPPSGAIILALVWLGASAGVALKLLFPRRLEAASICLYIGLGWLILTVIRPLSASVAAADFRFLMAGGIIYSAGVIFYLVDKLPYHKAIWHGFVLLAVLLHYAAVAGEFAV